jgi:hypothetical protein
MAKKKQTDGGADRHKHRLVGLRLGPGVREAAEGLARRERRSLAQTCAILIEEGLTARGLWSPPAEE